MTLEIVRLVSVIQDSVAKLATHFESNGIPPPSFNINVPADLGIPSDLKDIDDARIAALSACMELHDLLLGPRKLITTITNPAALQAIYRFDVASKFPIGEEISYQELSERCGLPEQDLCSLVRYAILHHRVFQEIRPGFISHTSASKLLAENGHVRDMVGLTVEEWAPAYTKTVDALVQFPDRKPNQTGFALANNTEKSFYEFLSTHPARIGRFAGAMKLLSADTGAQVRFLIDQYAWAALGSGTVVDVGGSKGHISIKLAETFPSLRFVVQDLPDVVAGAEQLIPPDVGHRFSFMDHDIFHEQTTHGDVYLLRYILHNWPDDECISIIRALVPALRPGSRILINDHIIPGPGVLPLSTDRELRAMDLRMMTIQNARERGLAEWESILNKADSRLRIVSVKLMDHSLTGLLEVELTD